MWSPFGPFWSLQYLNFRKKLPIRTAHHTFLESRHPEVTKNPYYVLSPERSHGYLEENSLIIFPPNSTFIKPIFFLLISSITSLISLVFLHFPLFYHKQHYSLIYSDLFQNHYWHSFLI